MDNTRALCRIPGGCVGISQKTNDANESTRFAVDARYEGIMSKDKERSFGVLARMRGLPERADELRQHLFELVSLTQAEIGCLSCELIENKCDSTEFTLIEEWSNENAHDAHFGTGTITSEMKAVHGLLSRELDSRKHVLRDNSVRYGTNSYCLAAG